MRTRFAALLLFGLLLLGGCKTDSQKVQGSWVISSFVVGGREQFEAAGTKVLFFGNTMSLTMQGVKMDFTFTLEPSRSPRGIDLTASGGSHAGQVDEGIYQLSGDYLRISVPNGGAGRPSSFGSPAGSSIIDMQLKRSDS